MLLTAFYSMLCIYVGVWMDGGNGVKFYKSMKCDVVHLYDESSEAGLKPVEDIMMCPI